MRINLIKISTKVIAQLDPLSYFKMADILNFITDVNVKPSLQIELI